MIIDINDNQTSQLILVYDVYADDTLSFWYKVSSEGNYDYLKFYIDGTLKENAGEDLIKILPEDCGEMEVGYEMDESRFYFVMFDPEDEDEEEPKLLAITIDLNKVVKPIKDFKMD